MESLFDPGHPDDIAPHPTPGDRVNRSYHQGQIYDDNHYAVIIAAELAVGPTSIVTSFHGDDTTALATNEDHEVLLVCRGRVVHRAGNDAPVSVSLSWFRGGFAETCPKLLAPERITEGTPAYIKAQTGRVVTRVDDCMGAAYMSDEEAHFLEWPPGTPVLRRKCFYYDQDDRLIEYSESSVLHSRWVLYQYEV